MLSIALLSVALLGHSAVCAGESLAEEHRRHLAEFGWSERVGAGTAVWVSIDEQRFRIVENGTVAWEAACATARNGSGSEMDSLKTPLGWHVVARKTGNGEPWGRVFRGGKATALIWKPGDDARDDLVLTRVLFLDGLEPGKNKGGKVDSMARCIYIHGTNAEDQIGTPSSHGCVRLRNDDVIEAYDRIAEGTPVLITEKKTKQ